MPAHTKVVCDECGENDLLPYGEDALEYGWHVSSSGGECLCDECRYPTPADPIEEEEMAERAKRITEQSMADFGEIAA